MNRLVIEKGPVVRRWLLLGLVGGLPLAILPAAYFPFDSLKLALLLIVVTIIAALRLLESAFGSRTFGGVRMLLIPAVAIGGPLLVAWMLSPYKANALMGHYGRFQGLIPYLLFIAAGFLLVDAFRDDPKPIAWALTIAGGVAGLYGALQWVGIDPFLTSRYTSGSTLGNPNFAGGFLAITLGPALYLRLTETRWKDALLYPLVAICVGIAAAFSLGGIAAALAATAVVLAWRGGQTPRERMLGPVTAALLAAAAAGVVVVTIIDVPIPVPDRNTATQRGQWWMASTNMGKDHPVFGRGPNSFAIEGIQYRVDAEAQRWGYDFPGDPHSVFFSFLTAAGILGALGFLTLVGWVTYRSRAVLMEPRGDPIVVAFLAGAFAYLVQAWISIDELPLRMGLWSSLAGLVIALQLEPRSASKRKRKQTRKHAAPDVPGWSVGAVVALTAGAALVAVGGYVGIKLLGADIELKRGTVALDAGDNELARTRFEAAEDLNGDYWVSFLRGSALALMLEKGDESDLASEVEESFSYLDDIPHVEGMLFYARALYALGRSDDAIDVLERARRIDPMNLLIPTDIAEILIETDRHEEAIALLEPLAPRVTVGRSIRLLRVLERAREGLK